MSPLPHSDSSLLYASLVSTVPVPPSFPAQPPLETHSELFIAAEQPHSEEVKNRVFNYYFLFLALLVGVLAVLFWWMHRHRRREQEQIRLRGQHALARDVERWAINRRNQPTTVEGLNESGEAPPPYKPKDDTLATHVPVDGSLEQAIDVTVPPRTLSLHETDHARLPEYIETIHIDDNMASTESARLANQAIAVRAGDSAA